MTSNNLPTWIIGVCFTVTQGRKAAKGEEIDVVQGAGGKIVGFSGRGIAYPRVTMDDGRHGVTAKRVLNIGGGWPFVTKQAWRPSNPNTSQIAVDNGDTGRITGYSDNFQWVNVSVLNHPDPNPRRHVGWIPHQVITFGTERRFGDSVTVNKNGIDALRIDVQLSNPSGKWKDTKVARAIKSLLSGLAANEAVLTELHRDVYAAIATENARDQATHEFVEGLSVAGVLPVLEGRSNCTIEDVLRACRETEGSEARGIYIRFYAKFRSIAKWQGTCRIYGGSAGNFKKREGHYKSKHNVQNSRSEQKGKGQHSLAYIDSGYKKAVIVCVLPRDSISHLWLAETVIMLLFGTYDADRVTVSQDLANAVPSTTNSAISAQQAATFLSTQVTDRECAEVEQDLVEEHQDFSTLSKDDKRASWGLMKVQAAQLLNIAASAFNKVDWVPLRNRPTFSGPHGKMLGLNIQTPICAAYQRPIFVKTMGLNRVFYRRTALSCVQRGDGIGLGYFGGSKLGMIWFTAHPQSSPPVGTKIYLTFEVTADGSPHPHSWARLPEICRYEDAARARTLAVKAEFLDLNNTWRNKYLQTAHMPARFNDNVPGGIKSLAQAVGILNGLEGKSFTLQHVRAFDVVFDPPRIIEIRWDPLRQVKTIEERKMDVVYIKPGGGLSDGIIRQQLENAGARNVGGAFGQFPDAVTGAANKRATCDRCMMAHMNNEKRSKLSVGYAAETSRRAHTGTCVQVPGTNQCRMCALYGMPCSWTRDVAKLPKLIKALWFPAEDKSMALTMEDPLLAQNDHETSSSMII